jgi:hypothetical protein
MERPIAWRGRIASGGQNDMRWLTVVAAGILVWVGPVWAQGYHDWIQEGYEGAVSVQAAAVSAPLVGADANSMVLEIDISDILSMDLFGAANNSVILYDVGGSTPWGNDVVLDGIGWDLTIQAVGDSWLSDALIYLDDAVDPDGLGVVGNPGMYDRHSGAATYILDVQDLTDNGIADVPLPDGWLWIEMFEFYDDYPGAMDAKYLTGSTLYVSAHPEPGTIMLLGLGIAGVVSRRWVRP